MAEFVSSKRPRNVTLILAHSAPFVVATPASAACADEAMWSELQHLRLAWQTVLTKAVHLASAHEFHLPVLFLSHCFEPSTATGKLQTQLRRRYGLFSQWHQRVQRAPLRDGDRIHVGLTVLVVRLHAHDLAAPIGPGEDGMPARYPEVLAEFER